MSITLSQLESHLWESANILRGPVDAADFKSYVFPLLFFKRISDVHDEEHAAALEEFDGDEESALFPENYGFQIPENCHWADVRKVATNVGQALQTAMRDIEQANPYTLYGIFGDSQWTNKDRLSDALIRDLIEHFSKLSLGNSAAKADVLGQSYEYLIKKFADLIECVRGLGPNLFYNSPMEACVVVCRTQKPKARRGKILFINAVKEVTRERGQSFLTDDHLQRVVRAYQKFKDEPGFTCVVPIDEIRAKEGNLSIPLYVSGETKAQTKAGTESPTSVLPTALSAWLESSVAVRKSIKALLSEK